MKSEPIEKRLNTLREGVGLAPITPAEPPAQSSFAHRNRARARKGLVSSEPGENPRTRRLAGKSVEELVAEGDIPLNDMEAKFVQHMSAGLPQTGSARAAGYADPLKAGKHLMKRPNVLAAVLTERRKTEEHNQMTRKRVMDGFLEAITLARLQADAISMISGWREIAKMCGYYEAVKHKLEITVQGQMMQTQLQAMSDEELLRLADSGGNVHEGEVVAPS